MIFLFPYYCQNYSKNYHDGARQYDIDDLPNYRVAVHLVDVKETDFQLKGYVPQEAMSVSQYGVFNKLLVSIRDICILIIS